MAVFTPLTPANLADLLSHYDYGTLENFQGIEDGVTNSNFRVTTTTGTYILTIFEELTHEQIPFFIHLNEHLAQEGLPCASTLRDKKGNAIHTLGNKPAIFMTFLQGKSRQKVNRIHIEAMGYQLAAMHHATKHYPHHHRNTRGATWHQQAIQRLLPILDHDNKQLLQKEMNFQLQQDYRVLPHGIIHADFFRDNVFFDGDNISGLIDFYYACNDYFLLDVAIVSNDWCLNEAGIPDIEKVEVLLHAYEKFFPLSSQAHQHWNGLLRAAALRFWLSRLLDYHFTPSGDIVPIKNPEAMKRILLFWQQFPQR